MAKVTRRYHSKKNGRYISRKQWLKEGKKGKAKREKIGIVPPEKRRKKKEREITPGVPHRTVERLQYNSARGKLDIDIIRIDGRISEIRVSKRKGHTRKYSRPADISQFSSVIHAAREQSALNKDERILEEIEDEE